MSPGTAAKRAEYKHLSALLFCWNLDAAERRQSAISRLLRGSGDLAECWFTVTCGEGFIRRQGKTPSDSLWMQAHANVLLPQSFLTGEVQFGPGAGRDGCPLHRADRGTRL